ncbi:MAG: hypothetical protein M3003_15155 [Candidatus Dormibacteraeota bacterium]|nr:hypothetical protein [Candidatus Dormibacteraeota bacterium]
MSDLLTQQLLKDRHSELLADAEQRRLARLQPPRESLVRLRLTIELQFGRRKVEAAKRLQAG